MLVESNDLNLILRPQLIDKGDRRVLNILDLPLRRRAYVDHQNDGERLLSDLVYPSQASTDVQIFSEGGTARLANLTAWHMKSIWQ